MAVSRKSSHLCSATLCPIPQLNSAAALGSASVRLAETLLYSQRSCRSKEAVLGLRSEPGLSLGSAASSSICHDVFCQACLSTGEASSSNSQLCSLASFHSSSLILLPENTRTMEISQISEAFQVFSKKHETSASVPC